MTKTTAAANKANQALRLVGLPIVFYFLCFCIFTYPLITQFSAHFFGGPPDGMQSAWNLWWLRKVITDLHSWPWYTRYVYFPDGVSLVPHDLNIFYATIGVFLQAILSLEQTYNVIVISGFVLSGLTMFWLAYYLTSSYSASVLGGFIFTFSSYHFAHALSSHLTVVSLQTIPLFVLCWLWLLRHPTIIRSLITALVLLVTAYTSLYFFLYCAMIGAGILLWLAFTQRAEFFGSHYILRKKYGVPLFIFVSVVLVGSAPLIVPLLALNRTDPMVATHIPALFSMDIFSLIVPGAGWRFSALTEAHWSLLVGNPDEHSVYWGLLVWGLLIYTWFNRGKLIGQHARLWYALLLAFVLLSLGTVFKVWGHDLQFPLMPYTILEHILPPLRTSGVPIRISVMSSLCIAILSSLGLSLLLGSTRVQGWRGSQVWLPLSILIILFFEYFPRPMPTMQMPTADYVEALKQLPVGGVLDTVADDSEAMFNQIVHEQPIALGYISRLTVSVAKKRSLLLQIIQDKDYGQLCPTFQLRYLVLAASSAETNAALKVAVPAAKAVYQDGEVNIYDLNCRSTS